MASLHERARNNVRAGIFVIVAIALGVATIVVLTDAIDKFTTPKKSYMVSFDVTEGVKNLKQGSEVRVGGVLFGRVTGIKPKFSEMGALNRIDVAFELDRRITLYADASIVVTAALIGGDARLDIFSVGDPAAGPADTTIPGFSGPGALDTLVGPANAAKVSEFVDDMKRTGTAVRDLTERIANDDWPRWATSVDEIMVWATGTTDKFDVILDDGRALFSDSRALVENNRPKADAVMTNLETASGDIAAVTERVREQTIQKVEDLLDRGRDGLETAIGVIEKVDEEFDFWSPQIREGLASARLAAQQIELTMIEVRRSPWKLLYTPQRGEVQHEMLFEAARSFAMAASDMKAATASAERLLNNHELNETTAAKLNEYLVDKVQAFEKAQQQLVDVLLTE